MATSEKNREEIFCQAIEMSDAAERAAYLDQACGADRELREKVEALLQAHERAVPKIIDFGIAKAVASPLTDKTFVTLQGQLLGTPEYMSPEQVDLTTRDIDTRSDIYSLGIVLYELLAGVLPFGSESFAEAGLAEIQQTIREREPASPSLRLAGLGEKAKTIAARRGTHILPLTRRLQRELEWIPLKAMRKDRCRRYKSASEMADDIRNYLNGNPLLAGPESAVYRTGKFVRKHRGLVVAGLALLVGLTIGLTITLIMYIRLQKVLDVIFQQ
jgi:serine/threonine protein kinase